MADANIKPRLGSPDVDKLKTREINYGSMSWPRLLGASLAEKKK